MPYTALNVDTLRVYVTRAMQTGTLADAAIAADYMARATRKPYQVCMNALCKRYNLRFADRACKDRPGMFIDKNPGKDMLRVTWDKPIVSEENVPSIIPAWVLA
jgi:hypothetical protein